MAQSNAYTLNPLRGRPNSPAEIVDYLITSALKLDASDIHLGVNNDQGPGRDPYLVRFRVHGKLLMVKSDFLTPFYREVIARFKVLANVSTTEIHLPQDGQIQANTLMGPIVLRIATLPSQDQDDLVVRVQRGLEKVPSLSQLNMTKNMTQSLNDLIHQKSGMIVLNGPAGSGKTTTIYAILGAIASSERKIITAEDPVEMRLPYVSHMQVSHKTDFAVLSRAFMRQDADVIFIGEVRDPSSAAAAIQLAQTGHLVLTTLHTRDSIGVISRLEAFDIHPNFIATSLIGSLSQRLVPRLCPKCKTETQPKERVIKQIARVLPPEGKVIYYKAGKGCENCTAGIAGRMPIFELFVADMEVAEAINQGKSKVEIMDLAKGKGMKTLAEDALLRVYQGELDLNSVYSYVLGPAYSDSTHE